MEVEGPTRYNVRQRHSDEDLQRLRSFFEDWLDVSVLVDTEDASERGMSRCTGREAR